LLGPGGGGVSDPVKWRRCHDKALDLFVQEYARHPEVELLDRLSQLLDSADLQDKAFAGRLSRLELRLTAQVEPPSTAEVLAILEGLTASQPEETSFGNDVRRRFEFIPRSGTRFIVEARGMLTSRWGGVDIQINEGTLRLSDSADSTKLTALDVGVCYQPIDEEHWRMVRPQFGPSVGLEEVLSPSDALALTRTYSLPLGQPLNLWRYWVCLRISPASGLPVVLHSEAAQELGCTTCFEAF
jgi:hypothetical protein